MKDRTTAPMGTNNKAELINQKNQLGKKLMVIEATISGPSFLTVSEEEKNVIMADRRAMIGYYEYLSDALRRIEKAEMNKAQAMGVGELPFKKARQMNMISFDMSGPPLSDNMKKVLSDMLMKEAIKRVMGVDQGQAPKDEPVGMDPQADSFEAIQEPPMRRFQVQTVTTKTELTTIGAFDEQDAIARVSHGQGDTGKNQLTVTSTAQLFA